MTLAEHNCIAYRKLAGTPIIDVPIADHASYVVPIGAELGAFLAVLDTSDPDQWTDLHVLVAPGTEKVTGIIDWSDAAVCDPARDFGLVLRDLGPAALDATLGQYPVATIFVTAQGLRMLLDARSGDGSGNATDCPGSPPRSRHRACDVLRGGVGRTQLLLTDTTSSAADAESCATPGLGISP